MMIIMDEVHGNISLSPFFKKVIDTPIFQRLRMIKQMGFVYLVYPGATHTRFEHSLGTYFLAGRVAQRILDDREEQDLVKLYALLHDIGHYPFSHEGERLLSKYFGSHEKVGEKLIKNSEISEIIEERFSIKDLIKISKSPLGELVHGDIGADRMDYLLRDSRNTGVAYGIIDIDRIISKLTFFNGKLVIEEGGLEAAESLLIARFLMFSAVYFHETVRVASAMFREGSKGAIEKLSFNDIIYMGDWDFLSFAIKNTHPDGRELLNSLIHRRLWKIIARNKEKFSHRMLSILEKEKIPYIMDLPVFSYKPVDFSIIFDGSLKKISEVSPLIDALKKIEEERQKNLIFVPEPKRDVAIKVLGK